MLTLFRKPTRVRSRRYRAPLWMRIVMFTVLHFVAFVGPFLIVATLPFMFPIWLMLMLVFYPGPVPMYRGRWVL